MWRSLSSNPAASLLALLLCLGQQLAGVLLDLPQPGATNFLLPGLDRLTMFAYVMANTVRLGEETRWPSSSAPRSTSTPPPNGSGRSSPTSTPTRNGTRSSPEPPATPAHASAS